MTAVLRGCKVMPAVGGNLSLSLYIYIYMCCFYYYCIYIYIHTHTCGAAGPAYCAEPARGFRPPTASPYMYITYTCNI